MAKCFPFKASINRGVFTYENLISSNKSRWRIQQETQAEVIPMKVLFDKITVQNLLTNEIYNFLI